MSKLSNNNPLFSLNKTELYRLIKKIDDNPVDIAYLSYILLNTESSEKLSFESRYKIYKTFVEKLEYINLVFPSRINSLDVNYFSDEPIIEEFSSTAEILSNIKGGHLYPEILSSTALHFYNVYSTNGYENINKKMVLSLGLEDFLKQFIDKDLNGEIFKINDKKDNYIIDVLSVF